MSAFSFAALESNPADSAPAISREEAPSSRTSSVSPQPSLQLHNGSSLEHDGERLPKSSAQPAQALAPAAQEEGPWQEVRTSRRKSGSQQAASKPTAQDPPRQGSRGKPNQEYSSPPPTPPPRKSQAAAQHPEEAPPNSGKGGVPPQAPPGLAAAGHWPQKPEPLPQPESPDSQLHPWPQELPSSMQIGSPQVTSADCAPDQTLIAAGKMLFSSPRRLSWASAPRQVRRAACCIAPREECQLFHASGGSDPGNTAISVLAGYLFVARGSSYEC